jgi:microsomal epoxide hydrolase
MPMRRHLFRFTLAIAVAWLATSSAAGEQSATGWLPSSVKTTFVDAADGTRIRTVESGSGPAILFVPGWTMSAEIWEKQFAHFAKARRVVAMDPRGQGESDKATEGLYPAARARDIKAVVDRLKLAPVVLVGWSMATMEVASFIEQFGTADLAAVAFVDGSAGATFDASTISMFMKFVGGLQANRAAMNAGFVRSMYKTPQSEAYLNRVAEIALKTPTSAAVALFVGTFNSDFRGVLPKIDKPALVAVAPGSPWDAAYAEMAKAIPNCRIVRFDGAGHALFVDQAEKFNAELEALMASSDQG